MSYVLRPAREKDLADITQLAQEATSGITSLPRNPNLLKNKILRSVKHFETEYQAPRDEFYLFVLEEIKSRKCIGVSGIYSKTGVEEPFFLYKLEAIPTNRALPEMLDVLEILRPLREVNSPTEICSLFLNETYRKEGLGKLLSFGRLLFIADHLQRFDETIFANMRGVIEANDVSTFWEAIGRRFCNVSFLTLMSMIHHNSRFTASLIPPFPIYVALLPPDVQAIIGKTHPLTTPALNLLIKEGFKFTQKIDPFDGGPILSCLKNEVKAIKNSQVVTLIEITDKEITSPKFLISNRNIDFRCTVGELLETPEGFILRREVADSLKVSAGDTVRIYSLQKAT